MNLFIINSIKKIFFQKDIFQENTNVDLQIYQSFFNVHDKQLIKQISKTSPKNLNNLQLNFQDIRLKKLFFRYKARNFPFMLNTNEKKIWLNHCLKVFNRFVLQEYINKIESLLKKFSSDTEIVNLLNTLLQYVFKKYKILFYQNINLN